MDKIELSPEAKKARADYIRNWRRQHPEKTAEYAKNYWEHKAEKDKNNQAEEEEIEE